MMHAKTAVVDGRWSRVGSTNLNIASWLNNRELDVIVENESFAQQMELAYLDDLAKSTEIVLEKNRRPVAQRSRRVRRSRRLRSAAAKQTAAGVMRLGRAVGAAIAHRRELGPAELVIIFWAAGLLFLLAGIAAYWPRVVAIPTAVVSVWISLSLLWRGYKLRPRKVRSRRRINGRLQTKPARVKQA
jgi:cardiolipin synthase